ncbi:DUF3391 domain-containing protein [Opacimonas viscosa]|uniref:DUF3391 domain-containing protein n=1 Tax=Opacimonas viscosa TaxID=2961944 RepID=A0AA41X343_9ALTE|nr:DUF3391 domain-containing protein [Opacimonas viscosa]MCP3427724.1 DUF3391 domain-containing protein [Opacimonas viscosa]
MSRIMSIDKVLPGMFVEAIVAQDQHFEVAFKGLIKSFADVNTLRAQGILSVKVNFAKSHVDVFSIPSLITVPAKASSSSHLRYPVGSVVRLNDAKLAIVSSNPESDGLPLGLMVFYDVEDQRHCELQRIEIDNPAVDIIESLNPNEFKNELNSFLNNVFTSH